MELQPPNAQVRIAKIRDVEWRVDDISEWIREAPDIQRELGVNMECQHQVNAEEHLLQFRATVLYARVIKGEVPAVFLRYTMETDFEIANFSEIITTEDEEEYSIPTRLLESLVETTISTMRGVLIGKTANFYFKDLYLPLINIQDIRTKIMR